MRPMTPGSCRKCRRRRGRLQTHLYISLVAQPAQQTLPFLVGTPPEQGFAHPVALGLGRRLALAAFEHLDDVPAELGFERRADFIGL